MPGDISRETFDPRKHYSGVQMQQGRMLLDADWNEQESISRHQLRTFLADILGPHRGFRGAFKISVIKRRDAIIDLEILPGHYYVDGILCENPGTLNRDGTILPAKYFAQPDLPLDPKKDILSETPFLVYLDVWERDITALEDPSIRDTALGGVDTATRVKVVWQVRTAKVSKDVGSSRKGYEVSWYAAELMARQFASVGGCGLRVRARKDQDGRETSVSQSAQGYRGLENRLYRIQVHAGGTAQPAGTAPATFKWSRENGSVAVPIARIDTSDTSGLATIEIQRQRADRDALFAAGDWVELVDEDYVLQNRSEPLLQVASIEDFGNGRVRLLVKPPISWMPKMDKCPIVRRWDHRELDGLKLVGGAIPIEESAGEGSGCLIPLEDGIEIEFVGTGKYRTGDYWLFSARTATSDVEWPRDDDGTPLTEPPDGIIHHCAPLAIVSSAKKKGKRVIKVSDCRSELKPLNFLKR